MESALNIRSLPMPAYNSRLARVQGMALRLSWTSRRVYVFGRDWSATHSPVVYSGGVAFLRNSSAKQVPSTSRGRMHEGSYHLPSSRWFASR